MMLSGEAKAEESSGREFKVEKCDDVEW